MNNKLRASPGDLLACFFSECDTRFRFLTEKHGYRPIRGLVTYRGGRQVITPWHGESAPEDFQAVCRFEKGTHCLEIVFNGAAFLMESYVYYDLFYRLAVRDVLRAARKSGEIRSSHWLVTHEDLLRESAAVLARTIKKHWRPILEPGPKIISRALTMRSKLTEEAVRAQYRKELEIAMREAAKAFRDKDYAQVVALLAPHERSLSSGDLKKLELARRSLIESVS